MSYANDLMSAGKLYGRTHKPASRKGDDSKTPDIIRKEKLRLNREHKARAVKRAAKIASLQKCENRERRENMRKMADSWKHTETVKGFYNARKNKPSRVTITKFEV